MSVPEHPLVCMLRRPHASKQKKAQRAAGEPRLQGRGERRCSSNTLPTLQHGEGQLVHPQNLQCLRLVTRSTRL